MFRPVDPKTHLPEIEHKHVEYWKKKGIFEKSIEQRKGQQKFVFFDGPPFANGLPHYGHILAQSLKDAVTRYFTMRGYYVPRVNGWDCHGLPVEYEIEKELGLSGRKDIEAMGIEAFNNKCRESVFRYTAEWNELFDRLGRWVDTEHGYATLNADYMESIWWVFKEIWKKKMLYQGFKAMHICPRCTTPLSNFEVSLGYKEVTDLSVIAQFELVGEPGTFFLAWTTTPWSLLTTMGLAVKPNIDYIKIKTPKGNFIFAEKRLEWILSGTKLQFEILERFKGEKILGKKYKHVFDFYNDHPEVLKSKKVFHTVPTDYVSDEDGTGIVTINGAFGEIDMEAAQLHELPILINVTMDGHYDESSGPFSSKLAKTQEHNLAEDLEKRGLLFKKENIRHSYPHCWRCDTALFNYATKAWFIRVSDIKEDLLKNNRKINWQPSHIKEGRFGKWLENVRDWNISRNRYWGCPIPVWECSSCKQQECIGSVEELRKRSGGILPLRNGELDLHKPYIDEIHFTCNACSGTMNRIPEVLDCWFESGAMPYAQLHYPFENKAEFEKNFPAHFIAEGLDQTRGWFYTLHVLATLLFNKPAFKNVIVNGILLAADGEKLSKRKKNYPDPKLLFEEKGVDTTRLFLYSSTAPMGEDVRFSEQHVDELLKKFTLTLWNTYSFFVTYANIDQFKPLAENRFTPHHKLDQWILSYLHSLIQEVTKHMDDYNLTKATRPLITFVDHLSNWYVRRSRRRFWKSENDADKWEAYQTLYTVLTEFSKLLAPFTPFIADEIYRNLTNQESVHLSDWPKAKASMINEELNSEIFWTRRIVNLGHAIRAKKKIRVRQPLKKVIVGLPHSLDPKTILLQKEVICEELNVKELELLQDVGEIAEWKVVPQVKILGQKYGKDLQIILQKAKKGEFNILNDGRVEIGHFILEAQEVELAYKGKEGHDIESDEGLVVALDLEISEDLILEGLMREVVRLIQDMRKEAGYEVSDYIVVQIKSTGDLEKAITRFADDIKSETLASELEQGGDMEWDLEKNFNIEGFSASIALRKVQT